MLSPLWYRLLLLLAALVLASGAIVTSLRAFRGANIFYRSFVGLYLLAALIIGMVIAGVPFDMDPALFLGVNPLWDRLLMLLSALALAAGAIITSFRDFQDANTFLRSFVGLYLLVALLFSIIMVPGALLAP